jgi:hypothetical protein
MYVLYNFKSPTMSIAPTLNGIALHSIQRPGLPALSTPLALLSLHYTRFDVIVIMSVYR